MPANYDELLDEVLQTKLHELHQANQERCPHDEDNGLQPDNNPACSCLCTCGCGRCAWARECVEKRCDCTVDLEAAEDETQGLLAEDQMRRDLEAYYYSTRGR